MLNFKKIAKSIIWFFINIVLTPFFIFFNVFNLFRNIKICKIRDERIGHLAINTELFLRRIQLNKLKTDIIIGVCSTKPSNATLLNLFKRRIRIIQFPVIIYEKIFPIIFNPRSILTINSIFYDLPYKINDFEDFNNDLINLKLDSGDLSRGKELLKKMKVDNWFICFHSRGPKYLEVKRSEMDNNYHNYRDCNVLNYMEATNYIARNGGYAIRMGAIVDEDIQANNENLIDYANKYRTDFGDIFLNAECKFFLGCTAGLYLVSTIFNRPVALANQIPLNHMPLRPGDLYIPKRIYSNKLKRELTFREIISNNIISYLRSFQYTESELGLSPIENTPEEILDLCIEMNEKIDGKWIITPEERELQSNLRKIFSFDEKTFHAKPTIATTYLRKNKYLLE